ncbi:nuclear transport factor 2 family protein [Paenibacillus antarcticus]|uniref:Steroid delta-isomerase n=1 Tax=Paenibacillus antarcticus TaxID=253703 RepID=A0A168JSZ1_9BACL|nr:ketosteroid isomerase family protein [Paenibacillus antarcticus]OAB41055.1 steroid delta-isomerase [Paenibacillus antarcticus]
MLEQPEIKQAMQQYIDHFNANDLESLLGLFSETASLEDPVGSIPIEGTEPIRQFYSKVVNGDTKIKLMTPICGSHSHSGAMAIEIETNAKGEKVVIQAIEIMSFDEFGKIMNLQVYWGKEDLNFS